MTVELPEETRPGDAELAGVVLLLSVMFVLGVLAALCL